MPFQVGLLLGEVAKIWNCVSVTWQTIITGWNMQQPFPRLWHNLFYWRNSWQTEVVKIYFCIWCKFWNITKPSPSVLFFEWPRARTKGKAAKDNCKILYSCTQNLKNTTKKTVLQMFEFIAAWSLNRINFSSITLTRHHFLKKVI